jgi:cytochrome c oxidase subunit II
MPRIISVLILQMSLAICGMAFGYDSGSQAGAVQTIKVSAKKYEFTPSEIRVPKGAKVELIVHSEDETHGIKLLVYPEGAKQKGTPGLLLDKPEDNGKVTKDVEQVIDFVAQEPGTYDFKCAKVCGMGHGRMKGKLIVEP